MKKAYIFIISAVAAFVIPISSSALAETQSADESDIDNPTYGLRSNFVVSPVKQNDNSEENSVSEDVYTLTDIITDDTYSLIITTDSIESTSDIDTSLFYETSTEDNEAALLEQINNASSPSELEAVINENSDALGIDLSKFHMLSSIQQTKVLYELIGQFVSYEAFKKSFEKEVYNAAIGVIHGDGSPGNNGNTYVSSGGGSGNIPTIEQNYSIENAQFENNVISLDLRIGDNLTENNIIYAAVYKANENVLITVAEVDFMQYTADYDGYKYFNMLITPVATEGIKIKLIGISSIQNLTPIRSVYTEAILSQIKNTNCS